MASSLESHAAADGHCRAAGVARKLSAGDARECMHSSAESATTEPPFSVSNASSASPELAPADAASSAGDRWRKMWTRCIWGTIMISTLAFLLAAGPVPVVLLVVGTQTAVFREVISIAHLPHKERKLPWFRTQMWCFLLATYYYLYGELCIQLFKPAIYADPLFGPLAVHHRFISFCLYISVLMGFVINLKKGHYRFQFNQFGLAHMTILLVVVQSQFVIHNILAGLFWFVLPAILVSWNDMMAYFFGFFFGRTPLIKVSPRKTWEGFLGAFVTTVLFGFVFSGWIASKPYFTCPIQMQQSLSFADSVSAGCDRLMAIFGLRAAPAQISCNLNPVFELKSYDIPAAVAAVLQSLGRPLGLSIAIPKSVLIRPVQLHALAVSVFVSLVAPFGGFFASGFKRAFKVKDFAASIPGHGGITDRMDCQFLAGFFVYLYYSSFISKAPLTPAILFDRATSRLSPEGLRQLYIMLGDHLRALELI